MYLNFENEYFSSQCLQKCPKRVLQVLQVLQEVATMARQHAVDEPFRRQVTRRKTVSNLEFN